MDRYINLHSHRFDPGAQITLINSDPLGLVPERGCFYSCGIHPWEIKNDMLSELQKMEELLDSYHEILAVGECGLDFHHNSENRQQQEEIFVRQLLLAEKFKRPVILHVVKAEQSAQDLIRKTGVKIPLVVHGFNKKKSVAAEWIKKGFYLSLGASLLQENSLLRETIKEIPSEKIFFETDNKNISVREIYRHASDILGCKEEALIDQVEINFEKLFLG